MTTGLLRKFSITYLLLPNLLFAIGWFRPVISSLMVIGFLYMFFKSWKKNDVSVKLSFKDLFIVCISACVCTFFSGVDGLSSQTSDWLVHSAKFYDLFKNNWPTYFSEVEQFACYYFGYYLMPALISKLYGELLPSVFIGWTFLGYALGLSWLYILLNKSLVAMIVLFFVRGTGHLIFFILQGFNLISWRTPNITPTIRSLFEQGSFATNQVIPTLIVTCILLYDFLNKKRLEESFFLIMLLPIWAIFPAAALGMIFGVVTLQRYLNKKSISKISFTELIVNYMIPIILFIPTLFYFLSSQSASTVSLLWDSPQQNELIIGHFTSIIIDLILLYIIFRRLNKIGTPFPEWLPNVLLASLLVLSFFKLGKYNDLFFRGSLPFCILLAIMMVSTVHSVVQNGKWRTLYPIRGFLLILALLAVVELTFRKRSLFRNNKIANYYLGERKSYRCFAYEKFPNTYQALLYGYKDKIEANQYLTKKDSFFEKYLCKKQVVNPQFD